MSFIVPMEKPKRCGLCPCFHAEHPMHCQAVKASKDKRIVAPYGAPIPDWCPLVEIPTPYGNLKDESDIISLIEVMFCKDKDGMEHAIQCVKDAPTVIEAEDGTDA